VLFGSFLYAATTGVAQETSFGSPEDQRHLIAGLCGTQLDIGPDGCSCLADRAMAELDDPQRTYLILSVVQPPAAERLPIAGSHDQLALIFGFLEKASADCRPGAAPGEGESEAMPGAGDAGAQ
jgi:hypothetical protein